MNYANALALLGEQMIFQSKIGSQIVEAAMTIKKLEKEKEELNEALFKQLFGDGKDFIISDK
jgi:hypothetical protein